MRWPSLALETALSIFFVYWMPRRGTARMRAYAARLRERPSDSEIQVSFSRAFAMRWWPLALLSALALELDGAGFRGPPVATLDDPPGQPVLAAFAPALIGAAVGGVALSLLLLARVERFRKRYTAALARLGEGWVLFPRSARAARWFVLVAITAGVCEEIAFRRLVPVYVVRLGGDEIFAPMIVSSLGFGLAHRYQGVRGMVGTGLIGFGLFLIVATTGSLWPAMCFHALIDLRVAATYPVLGPIPIPLGQTPAPTSQK